ncbi:MAG: folate family ECF transporter S component [Bacillota bacterium]|nr:folate family ECF transporter S component [Bacillota bacterium]HHU60436.1 folate family ECF transporter S component [Natronincola sp.]
MNFSVRQAANVGLLTAVSIVLTRVFGIGIPIAGFVGLRITLGEVPLILAGLLFGPLAGAIAGIASDVIGYLINQFGGPFFPGFAISAAITGFLPGVFLHKRKDNLTIWRIGGAVFATDLIAGVVLNTLWLTILYGKGFFILLPTRLVTRIFTIPVYTIAVFWLNRAYQAYSKGLAQ